MNQLIASDRISRNPNTDGESKAGSEITYLATHAQCVFRKVATGVGGVEAVRFVVTVMEQQRQHRSTSDECAALELDETSTRGGRALSVGVTKSIKN